MHFILIFMPNILYNMLFKMDMPFLRQLWFQKKKKKEWCPLTD